ncbi:diacylglycerol/lipid kinase family protein [Halomarina oriensis]|uniref:Diacylglycerol kinase family lipid kinase n=1 Tax=Halomarina oriensis TaxID=671145 RepID=A0A6B0GQS8_9EURY|nr:diacylglycerol kinase family protein [Halomarina oriensis]MWG35949.1 diacylglycerol kinase family lipid kinase [Halomarina oriensis]
MVSPEGDDPQTDMNLDGATTEPERTVVVLNPVSGDGEHGPQVRALAEEYGYEVRTTEADGDGIDIARRVAAEADRVVACGGDGTINHVVRGLWQADALADVTFGVVPGGTGNDFAENVGVGSVLEAFEILERGRTRRLDVGTVSVDGGTPIPFLNSCICGLTADASAATTPEQKRRYGVLAYAGNTLRQLAAYDGLDITIRPVEGGDGWSGNAALVLFGNARGFPGEEGPAADIEDGFLDVTVIEDRPAMDLVGGGALFELFDRDPDSLSRLRTAHAEVSVETDEAATFSLDGEMVSARELTVEAHRTALRTVVGPDYVVHPE